ncbi:crosslink repair DNA glycosylase YcaQ family protein [uncultured Jannaschia sp.]|uniref:winged helix-turn-helix domain-containing protein n=1 Tax=uncultured Jannaschia sp. TaxID=293347 RepID=UPI00260707AD|nr:crosslink repair DNA glycosylase YcaQ family protein [uncultured Jannaschia sp.]
MAALPRIDNRTARAIFLDRHGLAETPSGPGRGADLQSVISDLGFVQLDSVQTVARAHHMILHARRPAYRPRNLHVLHDRDRAVFEHWTHDASMIDMAHFPHWRLKFARYEARLAEQWAARGRDAAAKIDDVLRHIRDEGPCCSADLAPEEPRAAGGWWNWHPSKVALEYLWRTGALSVTRRDAFRKVYDLTENVIPAERLAMRHDTEATIDWACGAALDRLGFATHGELAAFWDLISPAEAKDWVAAARARGEVAEAEIECVDGRWRKSILRPALLGAPVPEVTSRLRILSPFDPALRDRKRAERLFGFSYRIEIFVPEAQRTYGYYVFPILEGDRLVGRIDAKVDRDADRLQVRAVWPEPGIRFGTGRTARLEAALDRTARLVGIPEVSFEAGWLR